MHQTLGEDEINHLRPFFYLYINSLFIISVTRFLKPDIYFLLQYSEQIFNLCVPDDSLARFIDICEHGFYAA